MEHFEPINIDNIFGKTVKQSKFEVPSQSSQSFVKKSEKKIDPRKKKEFTEIGIHRDKEFEKTLIDLDDELFLQNEDILDKTIESALSKGYDHSSSVKSDMDMKGEYPKLGGNISGMKRALETDVNIDDHVVKKKSKFEHTDSGIDSQERNEKKRYCATQYQQYLNRSGPKNHGCKAIPKGTPDCLANLCFIRTGVLDSLEAEEFEDLIKQHGGRVVHAVSRKVNFVVVGEDAGKAKLAKAANYGIPNINEDELLDMISQKSKTVNKSLASNISSFEDAGIDDSFISCDSEEATVIKNQPAAKIVKYSDDKIVLEPGKKKELVKESEKNTCVNTNKAKIKVERKEENSGNKFVETKSNIQKLESNMESAEKLEASNICLSEKYKPKELKQIIGQQVNNSNMHKLKKWLESWYENERLRKEKKIPQHRSWDKTNDGAFYKCALLSGSPGVGKTTTAVLVAECLGYDIIEFNASDTRSKKLLQQEVSNALSTKNISSFNVYNKGRYM
ncbi:hypothetical protein HHI36_004800 [Cryptolaemus montrouzieri]|uniref:BRCT domain-containing protein n=1 Tax=Cryptolaemus montrouzieri TaxID=559131 RepID=A0ABD2NS92_9CUCU